MQNTDLYTQPQQYEPSANDDFTGSGVSDILFRNADGETYLWTMNGANVASGAPTSTQVGENWQVEGIGDFTGSGTDDLLWVYNDAANAADPLNGVGYISFHFTGAGQDDILFRYEDAAFAERGDLHRLHEWDAGHVRRADDVANRERPGRGGRRRLLRNGGKRRLRAAEWA